MDLAVIDPSNTAPITQDLVARVADFCREAKAPATRRAYRAGWRQFESWCRDRGLRALPAEPTVTAAFIADRASKSRFSTLNKSVAAIRYGHVLGGFESPTKSREVATVMAGIKRVHGTRPKQKAPLLVRDLRAGVDHLGDDLRGCRDRALVLVGFAAGLRRSEIVGLDVEDLVFEAAGVAITLRRSKTDQEAQGRVIGVGYGSGSATCPVVALRRWLANSGIQTGPVFRAIDRNGHVRSRRLSDRAVALLVKRVGRSVGLDPASLGGHSLRAGFVTSAAMCGVPEAEIQATSGHRSLVTLRSYIRRASVFETSAVQRLGL